jgi:hypothetical protein
MVGSGGLAGESTRATAARMRHAWRLHGARRGPSWPIRSGLAGGPSRAGCRPCARCEAGRAGRAIDGAWDALYALYVDCRRARLAYRLRHSMCRCPTNGRHFFISLKGG